MRTATGDMGGARLGFRGEDSGLTVSGGMETLVVVVVVKGTET